MTNPAHLAASAIADALSTVGTSLVIGGAVVLVCTLFALFAD